MTRPLTLTLTLFSLMLGSALAAGPELKSAANLTEPRFATVGQFDRVIPFVLNGGPFKTSFVLTNLDAKPVNIEVYFIGTEGQRIKLPISGIGTVSGLFGSMGVNQTLTFETDGSGEPAEAAVVFFTRDGPADDPNAKVTRADVGGLAIVQYAAEGEPGFQVTIPVAPEYETRFTLPFDNRNGVNTGLILLNASMNTSPLKVVVRDMDGKVIAQDSATLDPTQRISVSLADVFPQVVGQAGVVQLSTTAIGLSGMGMRIDPNGRFTAIQTFSAPADPEAPKPPAPVPTTLPGVGNSCASIEGALLFANNGQYLGKVTSNKYDLESLGNEFGKYGSPFSSVSIYNDYGTYGGAYAALSPFNPYTSTPPVLFLNGRPVVYLTANRSKAPNLHPDAINPCIGRK